VFLCFGSGIDSYVCLVAQSLMMCLVGERVQSLTSVYMVSKSPRPAPYSHWTLLLILKAGTREPRMQRFVARNIARFIRAFTNPFITE
jgi:hypothetical protein